MSVMLLVIALAFTSSLSIARTTINDRERANKGSVRIITWDMASEAGRFFRLPSDLSEVLDDPGQLHVVPIVGLGGTHNVMDMLYLRGVDLGIIQSDILKHLELQKKLPSARRRMRLIAKLQDIHVHVISRRSTKSIADLIGKRVGVGPKGSSSDITARTVVRLLKIKPRLINMEFPQALAKLQSGELAAVILSAEKPSTLLKGLRRSAGLHLLSLKADGAISKTYSRTLFSSKDYPNLIDAGEHVRTIKLAAILAVLKPGSGSGRYSTVNKFVKALYEKIDTFRVPGRHAAWRRINLAENVKGWQRYSVAKRLMKKIPKAKLASGVETNDSDISPLAAIEKKFERFVTRSSAITTGSIDGSRKSDLFQTFLSWPNNQIQSEITMRLTSTNGVGKVIGSIAVKNTQITIAGRKETALMLQPKLKGLRPGRYAFHIYKEPRCGPGIVDGRHLPGLAAGGHVQVEGSGSASGKPLTAKLGDLPDLEVSADGKVIEVVLAPRLTLADLANRSLIIHANAKVTSPRIGCGTLK